MSAASHQSALEADHFNVRFPLSDGRGNMDPCYFWVFLMEFCSRFAKLGGMRRCETKLGVTREVVRQWILQVQKVHGHSVSFFDRKGNVMSDKQVEQNLQSKVQRDSSWNQNAFPILQWAFSQLGKRELPVVQSTRSLTLEELADEVGAETMEWFVQSIIGKHLIEANEKDIVASKKACQRAAKLKKETSKAASGGEGDDEASDRKLPAANVSRDRQAKKAKTERN